jgi:hypothetical protein
MSFIRNMYAFDSGKWWTAGVRCLKFYMEMTHKPDYSHDDSAKSGFYMKKKIEYGRNLY